jgi:hypothetical protein
VLLRGHIRKRSSINRHRHLRKNPLDTATLPRTSKARASVMSVQSLWPQKVYRGVSRALLCSSSQCHRLALHWSTTPAEAPSCSYYTFAPCYVVLCVSCFAQWLHLALCCVSGVVLPCSSRSYDGTQRLPSGWSLPGSVQMLDVLLGGLRHGTRIQFLLTPADIAPRFSIVHLTSPPLQPT